MVREIKKASENERIYDFRIEIELNYCCTRTSANFVNNKFIAIIPIYIHSHHMPVRLKDSMKQHRMQMQHAEWLGNSTSLVLVHENDIYIRQSPSDEEDIRLTDTGVPGIIYNGVTDWLYQGMNSSEFQILILSNSSFAFRGNFEVSKSAVEFERWLFITLCNVQR